MRPPNSHIDQKTSTSWETPYKFSGKEKDDETGYSYFGARYYNSDLSVWLSVDPMAHRYNSLSPYIFVANNPINLVDPDGRKIMIEGNAKFNKLMLSRIIGLAIISKSSRKLIFDLIKSDQVIKIVDSKEHHNKATQTTGFDKDGYIMYWNEDDANDFIEGGNGYDNEPLYNNSFLTLAHELSHAWSKFNNIDQWTYYSPDYKWNSEGDDEGTWFVADEFNAVHFENIVRAELGYKLRTHYQGINVFKLRASIEGSGKVEKRTDNTDYDSYRRNNTRANGSDVQNKIKIKKSKGAFDRHKTVLSL